ncbi:MAG: NADH-ubiquinone oxidoreductase-F iron-sulfur binding region domain-containing protein [Planctomycetota bacterium]|nr:NADH-ubiquinone oxidoreductase-F iron-sulfur binding region domain-containing protein [Planctomycetota bacterium]
MTTRKGPILFREIEPEAGLEKALEVGRSATLLAVRNSELKGRGGAGFPTGVKWNFCATTTGDCKYVICNADEGEPGTFKDRVLLMEYADYVFEGMTVAAYCVGAKQGMVYLRGEYTYMREHLENVLAARREKNLLGENIKGKEDFSFDIEIFMGAGAYVCGEETALIESMEGNRGEPRNRPPYPVTQGYNGCPTIVNNVETFATIPHILDKGAEWFKEHGTGKSKGSKLLSVSGDCENPGVYELPLGITVKELLEHVGGENAKAVQIGGAAGHCVPADSFGRTISYEDVSTGGSIIIFGPDTDMLDIARNFLEFFKEESCGQCTPCRIGNVKLLECVEMLENGECSNRYLKEIVRLGETMRVASKCGLGQSSPNAFLSIVENFQPEILGRTQTR